MDAVLGIDIGKIKFHVTLLFPDGTRRRKACANSPAGCAELLAWLTRPGARRVHACLEATGTYGEVVATTLVEAGHQSVYSIRRSSITTPKVSCGARKPTWWMRM
ncbi:MAG TPA: transposase [Vicinamibacterales bacterium]|jgi:transposase|nr:transposase [Vicinamibacterales bacterium]